MVNLDHIRHRLYLLWYCSAVLLCVPWYFFPNINWSSSVDFSDKRRVRLCLLKIYCQQISVILTKNSFWKNKQKKQKHMTIVFTKDFFYIRLLPTKNVFYAVNIKHFHRSKNQTISLFCYHCNTQFSIIN